MKLAKILCGVEHSEAQVVFDLICHLGTLLAVLLFFKREIFSLFFEERRKLYSLILALFPLIPCYFLLKPLRTFASQPQFLGICLMMTALILFLGQKIRLERVPKRYSDALWIGAMQSAALIPGISRSASTISCARMLGWEVKDAVRFSFLLSIPTIIGGNALEILKLKVSHTPIPSLPFSTYMVGFCASFFFGWLIIRFAIAFLEKGNLKPFAWYCLSMGILSTLYLTFGGG